MSRNSKNARLHADARRMSETRKSGSKGPSATNPAHGKKFGYRDNPERLKKIAEALKAAQAGKVERTSGARILRSAGKAAEQPAAA